MSDANIPSAIMCGREMTHESMASMNLREQMKEKTKNRVASMSSGTSPYTIKNVDAAIAHLEQVLCAECADSIFGRSYWRARVLQISTTSGLMRTQWTRLQRLLELLPEVSTPTA